MKAPVEISSSELELLKVIAKSERITIEQAMHKALLCLATKVLSGKVKKVKAVA